MKMKVGVNGFGRIGRDVVKAYVEGKYDNIELVAINASGDFEALAHIFKYDTMYGKYQGEIEATDKGLKIGGRDITFTNERDPRNIPWKELGVDLVIDSTGAFKDREGLNKHIEAGAKKVILTAAGKDLDLTVVKGVNHEDYDPAKHNLVSNASCTTNCLAPVAKVILDNFGIKKGLMTTVHAYTNDQKILDNNHSDLRRARAAAENLIPTTTGAAKAVALVVPELKGKLNGFAVRVPVPTVSLVDVVFEVEKEVSVEEVNAALKAASEGKMAGVLGYSDEPLVSSDYVKNPHSSIVDSLSTMVIDNMVKVVSWYDNEWGYSTRVVDLADYIASRE